MFKIWEKSCIPKTPTLLTCKDPRLYAAGKGLYRRRKKEEKIPNKLWGAEGKGEGVDPEVPSWLKFQNPKKNCFFFACPKAKKHYLCKGY